MVLERFHLAIAIVTIVASTMFLLALSVMLVDERRETVGILRLIGLTTRRILAQVFVEGLFIAVAGALFGLGLALASEGLINRYFQWRYDTALVFVRITPAVALRSVVVAVPLGALASVARILGAAAPQRPLPRSPMNALAFAWRGPGSSARARRARDRRGRGRGRVALRHAAAVARSRLVHAGPARSRRVQRPHHGHARRLPGTGPRIGHISETAAAIAALAGVDEAVPLRLAEAEIAADDSAEPFFVSFFGAGSSRRRPWTIVDGRDVAGWRASTGEVLLNRQLADLLGRRPGEAVRVRASCGAAGASTLPPIVLTRRRDRGVPVRRPLAADGRHDVEPRRACVRR